MTVRSILLAAAGFASLIATPASSALGPSSSPEARSQLQAFGSCVADHSAGKAARTLSSDFRSIAYRSAIRTMLENNRDCSRLLPYRSRMAISKPLLFAGALAERLMALDHTPLNVRLANAAARPSPEAFSPTDVAAMCVVRAAPDETGRLFASAVGSVEEAKAMDALGLAIKLCTRQFASFDVNTEAMRAMLATAAFRSVAPLSAAKKS